MAFLSSLILFVLLVTASNARLIWLNEKGQKLFQLRQSIYAARELLQNECPIFLTLNHGILDDSAFPFHVEVTTMFHSKLLDSLAECLVGRTSPKNMTTQTPLNQSPAADEVSSTPLASQQLLTEQPTTEQTVTREMPLPQDCQELYDQGNRCSEVYQVNPPHTDSEPFPVWCDFFDGRGWTVFQKRVNGSVSFNKNWTDYQAGFGEIAGEYWLGLAKIHLLTRSNTKLSIFLRAANGTTESGVWPSFYINGLADGYKLIISDDGYRGSLDSFKLVYYHNGMKFSTPDRDQDLSSSNCAQRYQAGWWFNNCQYVLLNALEENQIEWYNPHGRYFVESVMRVTRD
ncbi:microfibril-associated glycoprotein 4-like [Watersipora subatra]|uniref:microfibril-associated glycoprotein 4-like n=1 Tax=Watersipora subatra TaxID=2589382 RepID=UPI00355B56C0